MRNLTLTTLSLSLLYVFGPRDLAGATDVAQPSAAQMEFFENKVRPALAKHCYDCHSARAEKLKAGLHLDSRAGVFTGGDTGPVIVPGKPEDSLLIKAIGYRDSQLAMPPDKKLDADTIALLSRWVAMGAPWPQHDKETAGTQKRKKSWDWANLRQQHWAWQPVQRPTPPPVKRQDWPSNPIDYFVLAKLEANQMTPAKPADRRTLIRRAYLDLIGLPPEPDAVDNFVNDTAPDAFARVVDRLLASQHYGERWARRWLDVARYSDGYGGSTGNAALPNAFRYRDWVVEALSQDLPYNEFVRSQIAGDLINGGRNEAALGFLTLGPTYQSDGGDPASVAKSKAETLDDRVDTVSRGFLGLTVSCARCHDHKFDPIPTLDYYSLGGVFLNTKEVARPLPSIPKQDINRYHQEQKAIGELNSKLKQLRAERKKAGTNFPAAKEDLLTAHKKTLEKLKKSAHPKYPTIHSLAESGSADMKVALRGDMTKPGEVAPRRFLRIVSTDKPRVFKKGSGRLELANALASPDNPLTARVFVNRIWMHHFGKGIVRTPSNFGVLGQPPTHPQLLDWLARHFIDCGWSVKQLHRTILLSSSYQMSSEFHSTHFKRDGDNTMVWRMNPRRLDVEAWRDSLLAVSGALNPALGGPPVDDIFVTPRRTLYSKISRSGDKFKSDEFLRLFDFPGARASAAERSISTVPQQYLFMLNSDFMRQRARELSDRLAAQTNDNRERIRNAYNLLLSRAPTADEEHIGLSYLESAPSKSTEDSIEKAPTPWEQYAQVLLSCNEFLFLR